MAAAAWRQASFPVGLRLGQHCRRCVVAASSVGEGPQTTGSTPIQSGRASSATEAPFSMKSGWRLASESAVAAQGVGSSNAVDILRANRSVRLFRNESKRLSQRRLAAFASAVALTALAFYGQDLLDQLGRLTSLPVEELDGLIYFVICFNAVSLVLPRSRLK